MVKRDLGSLAKAASVALGGAAVVAVVFSAVLRSGHLPWPAWATAVACVVLGLAATLGRRSAEAISARLAQPVEQLLRRDSVTSTILRPAKTVAESRSRVALNVHPAIPLPEKSDPELSTELPEYVSHEIDEDLRTWIRGHTETGGMVVLVGDAAVGKTRCLFEALDSEVPGWRMPYVDRGVEINTMVRERIDFTRTVLWLDELQNFFADDTLTAGSVRQLIAGRLGPVLIAGTIRAEELEKLLIKAASDEEREAANRHHAREVIRMLARWSKYSGAQERAVRFHVDRRFNAVELARTATVALRDPRLREALRDTDDGNVTAVLAGAPELIDRWILDTGNRYGRAIITAAVIARRCGHPQPIPIEVLEALAVSQLAAMTSAPTESDWLPTAITWAQIRWTET